MGDCKTCTGCKEKKTKTELPENIPYIAYDMAQARNEREKKRLWILVIISWISVLLVVGVFTYERLQYDTCSVHKEQVIEAEQDGEGINIVGGGNIEYGADSTDNYTESDTNPN